VVAANDLESHLAHRVGDVRIGGVAPKKARDLGEVVQQFPRLIEFLGHQLTLLSM
jgi:hypothetical protein